MNYRYGNNPNQYGYTSQYRGNQPEHSENHGGFGMSNAGGGFSRNAYGRSQYQGLESANQYGYTSQYRGNLPEHNENHGGFGMSNIGGGYTTGANFAGGNVYAGGGTQGFNPANQYGYTSQYRGNQPEHSEDHGGFGMSTVGAGYGAGSQYQGLNQANQYGYTSQYRGNQPEHNENHGGFGLSNVSGGYTTGAGFAGGRSQYQGLNQANQYGYTSQYRGNQPEHNENLGGPNYQQTLNQMNQYGYTAQYRGNQPEHNENHGGFGMSNVAGGYTTGAGFAGGNTYTGAGSQYQGFNPANQYGYTNQFSGYSTTGNQANQYGYTNQYRGYTAEHSEEPYGGSF